MLVHRRARRQGLAKRLLSTLEHEARREGKTVLVTGAGSGCGRGVAAPTSMKPKPDRLSGVTASAFLS